VLDRKRIVVDLFIAGRRPRGSDVRQRGDARVLYDVLPRKSSPFGHGSSLALLVVLTVRQEVHDTLIR
jgi:hypothetical protein